MAKISPPAPRARVSENWQELRVLIPVRRDWFALVFISFWLAGWALGEVMVLGLLLSGRTGPATLFLLAWLGCWTWGGAWALFNWCWNAGGREVTVIRGDTFSVRYEAFGMGKTWEFDAGAVRNLRVVQDGMMHAPSWMPAFFQTHQARRGVLPNGIWSGPLAFDYGAKTYRFGAGIDEAEARDVLPLLLARFSPDDGR